MESKKQAIYKDGRWIQLASGSSGETNAIELNLNDGSWETQEGSDGIKFIKTCSEEEIASLSVNNVRLTGTVQLPGTPWSINTSTLGIFNLMHMDEFSNAWNQKTFLPIVAQWTITIATYANILFVSFTNKTEYNRRSTGVDFTPIKTTTEHYYHVYITGGTMYSLNINDIDSVQFRYPLGNNQELVFPVIQKLGSDAIKNIVSTVYNGHIYEIHFSKDNPESSEPSDKHNKLIIRHMDGTVDNDAIGTNTIHGYAELRGHTLFMD